MQLLRFITAGSVDDGKSTLIGRLLHDSKSIFEDQFSAIARTSEKRGAQEVDLALLTDGLQAEREQGITIDVAYRYFATPKRKFIIGDSPGHEQYTRNMVTAASTANLAIILVDAAKGILVQTRRHTYIASLLGIPHLVLAVNKMDSVDYSREVFDAIAAEYRAFAQSLGFGEVHCIPMSALKGDMVVERGDRLSWYQGSTLLELLETVTVDNPQEQVDFRFPVQWVCRPQSQEYPHFRGYAGRIESGSVSVGDEVTVLPSGQTSKIKEIYTLDQSLQSASAPASVTLLLEDERDISRGDMIVSGTESPRVEKEFKAMLCWLSEDTLQKGRKYFIKHTTRSTRAIPVHIDYRVDVNTLEQHSAESLSMNDIACLQIKTQGPLVLDAYRNHRATGSFILIDEASNNTVAAGMML